MPTGTVTSKGQITIPKEIRDLLKLNSGQELDFVVQDDGHVVLCPRNRDVRRLKGVIKAPAGKRVTVRDMEEAIAEGYADL